MNLKKIQCNNCEWDFNIRKHSKEVIKSEDISEITKRNEFKQNSKLNTELKLTEYKLLISNLGGCLKLDIILVLVFNSDNINVFNSEQFHFT